MEITISQSDVAAALHLDSASDLPTGADDDIAAAETLVNDQVAPDAAGSEQNSVKRCAIYVAACFITGTDGDAPLSSISRQSVNLGFDTSQFSDEATDYWQRAVRFDPTGNLAAPSGDISFEVY